MSEKNKIYQYPISNISIKDHLIRWDDHALWISGISRMWLGRMPEEPYPAVTCFLFLFLALSGQYAISMVIMGLLWAAGLAVWIFKRRAHGKKTGVCVQLHGGDILLFESEKEEVPARFYEALANAVDGRNTVEVLFDAAGGVVVSAAEEEPEKTTDIMELSDRSTVTHPLIGELKKLYVCHTQKLDTNSEILSLIDETARMLEAGDRSGVTESFKQFVTLGLISDCNELGLGSLIQEIKSSLYGGGS